MVAVLVRQQVYQTIKRRILNGEYAFGEKLNIDALCKELSVSNSPVREALSLLVNDQLVVLRPNTGAHVFQLNVKFYNELTDAVNTLLLGAYEICCRRKKKELLLSQLQEQMKRLEYAVKMGNERERIYAILRFDRCFVTATENRKSIALFDNEMDILYLAYVYNHQNRTIDWNHNIERSGVLLRAVSEDCHQLVRDILCERSNPHIAD